MRLAFLLVVIFPIHAEAGIVTATPAQQAEIMAHVNEALGARASAQLFEARMKAANVTNPEEAERYMWLAKAERAKTADNLDLATKKTLEYYGIAPAGLQFNESQTARQGPMIGAPIRWAPTVLDADHQSFQYTDANNQVRHDGGPLTEGGVTWGNGQVSIHIDMFIKAMNHDHPGVLAYILHHESQHFEEKITRAERTYQEDEMSAFKASLDMADIFELGNRGKYPSMTAKLDTREEWIATFTQARGENAADLRDRKGRSVYMTPTEEAEAKDLFEIDQKELARIQAETTKLKEAAAKSRLVREEQAREELRAREAAEAAAWQDRHAAAAECGYTPVFQGNTGIFLWYAAQNELGFLRQPTSTTLTTDQYRIAFLINRACYGAVHNSERNPPRACNDAARLIRSFATQDNGAAKLDAMFGPDRGDRRCLYRIINQSSGITDSASFNKVIAKYHKQLEKERREHDKNWRSDPPRSDEGKPERGRPPNGNDKDYFWDPGCECWVRRY